MIATLRAFARRTVNGVRVSEAKVDLGGDDNRTASHYGSPGDDSHPLPGDTVVVVEAGRSGEVQAVGYLDPANGGEAAPGEKRLYARDGGGSVKAVVWLKADGTVVVSNDGGSIELGTDGDVTINGVTIDSAGNISAPGEVSAMAAMPATAVKLSTHIHPTPAGASSPPTPGT